MQSVSRQFTLLFYLTPLSKFPQLFSINADGFFKKGILTCGWPQRRRRHEKCRKSFHHLRGKKVFSSFPVSTLKHLKRAVLRETGWGSLPALNPAVTLHLSSAGRRAWPQTARLKIGGLMFSLSPPSLPLSLSLSHTERPALCWMKLEYFCESLRSYSFTSVWRCSIKHEWDQPKYDICKQVFLYSVHTHLRTAVSQFRVCILWRTWTLRVLQRDLVNLVSRC